MALHRYPYDGDAIRRSILAVAEPGKLLPAQSDLARLLGCAQPNISHHLEILRDQWRLVTREVWIKAPGKFPQRRLLVVEVPA